MNRKIIYLAGLLFFVVFPRFPAHAKLWKISSATEFESFTPQLREKDSVIWENGSYEDVVLILKSNGIAFLAETPGKVIFTGKSSFRISADKVTFSGFQFLNGSISGNVVTVSGSYCRISQLNISGYRSHYYFEISKTGRFNEVAWCNFEKKPQAPPGKEGTSVFQVAVDSLHPGNNVIRWCSFRDFHAPEGVGSDYGMEAFRPGYSYQCKFVSRTLMEYCYFTRCNGDGEIISNKARENVYRYNTFESNGESHVTLRHGSNTSVYGNFFLEGAGIRIKEGQNNMVYNNYFSTGKYFSIRLENYRVDPLRNILIAHNTFVASGPMKLGGKGDYPPEEVVICNNLVVKPTAKIVEDQTGRETIISNYTSGMPVEKGFTQLDKLPVANDYGFTRSEEPLRSVKIPREAITDIPAMEDDPDILLDIAKNKRREKKSAGCYEPVRNGFPVKPVVTAFNTGPSYLQKEADTAGALVGEGFREYTYKTIDTLKLKLFVKKPEDVIRNGKYPAIVFFFGGGWNSGSISQFKPHADYLVSHGMVAVLAEYRVKSRHQTTPFEAVADARSVIRYLREHAGELGIDPSRLAAAGGSAGGHLAAATATLSGLDDQGDNLDFSCKPDALVLFNPVIDNGPEGYGYDRIGERFPEISPMHNIRKGVPPAIFFLGTSDNLIPVATAKDFQHKMKEAGSRCDLFLYEGQKHGFFNFRNDPENENTYYRNTLRETHLFLKSLGYLKGNPTI